MWNRNRNGNWIVIVFMFRLIRAELEKAQKTVLEQQNQLTELGKVIIYTHKYMINLNFK